jgi:hypothetical protein
VAEAVSRRAALAVVAYLDLQRVGRVLKGHLCATGMCVLERVGEPFLHDSIGGEVDSAREWKGIAGDVEPDGEAGPADVFHERAEPVDARVWGELEVVAVAAHRSEQSAHLGERRAAGLLDAPEGFPVLLQGLRELVPDGADLKHHHADCMGNDVVQLARDPRALLRHRDACNRLALALGLGRAHFGRLDLR